MQRYLVLVLLCFVSVGLAMAQSTAKSTIAYPTERGRVAESSRAVLEAQKTKNPDAIKQLLADDFVLVGSDGKLADRDELMDVAREGRLQTYQIYDQKIIQLDDQNILVTYDLIVTGTEGENARVPRYQRVSDVWSKSDDPNSNNQWRLKFEQATPQRHVE